MFFVFYWCLAGKLGSWSKTDRFGDSDFEAIYGKSVEGENEALKIWEGGWFRYAQIFPLKELGDVKKVPAVNFPGCTPKTQDASD